MAFLITPTQINELAYYNAADEDIFLESIIRNVQEVNVRQTLGNDLYQAVIDDPLTYDTLVSSYLRPFMAFQIKTIVLANELAEIKSDDSDDTIETLSSAIDSAALLANSFRQAIVLYVARSFAIPRKRVAGIIVNETDVPDLPSILASNAPVDYLEVFAQMLGNYSFENDLVKCQDNDIITYANNIGLEYLTFGFLDDNVYCQAIDWGELKLFCKYDDNHYCAVTMKCTSDDSATWLILSVIKNNFPTGFQIYGNDDINEGEIRMDGTLRFVGKSAPTSILSEGAMYFDSTTKKHRCYDGTSWHDLY